MNSQRARNGHPNSHYNDLQKSHQERHFNGPVTAAVRVRGNQQSNVIPNNGEDYGDESVQELKKLKGNSVIRMKSAAALSSNQEENDFSPDKNSRRLDWRLGQRINDLIATGDGDIVLGHGSAKDLKFQWLITPWSACSQPCGMGVGFRVRLKINSQKYK